MWLTSSVWRGGCSGGGGGGGGGGGASGSEERQPGSLTPQPPRGAHLPSSLFSLSFSASLYFPWHRSGSPPRPVVTLGDVRVTR